jgi:GMC oxidoreductase
MNADNNRKRKAGSDYGYIIVGGGSAGAVLAVVDFHGNVYKVKGLRVVDASIFPDAVSAAPNPTVIMTAEKIADQIKKSI